MDTQNPNLQPVKPADKPDQQPTQPDQEQKIQASAEPEYLFYNVMPRQKKTGDVVSPVVKIEQEPPAAQAPRGPMNKYMKWGIIIIVILAVAGAAGYFIYEKFVVSLSKSDIVLNENAPKPNKEQPGNDQGQASSTEPSSVENTQEWKDWLVKYFNTDNCQSPNQCGPDADADRDGLSNQEEFKMKTDPNNPDSDQDGLADGDEFHVFMSDPLNSHSAGDPKYSDSDFIKGGYSLQTGNAMTQAEIDTITAKMKQFNLHQPTITALGEVLITTYKFTPATPATSTSTTVPAVPSTTPETTNSASSAAADGSPEAKQDRDAQRTTTMKNIAIALTNYKKDLDTYPKTTNFSEMVSSIKPYLRVAMNPVDPINKNEFVYTYTPNDDGTDYVLTFYSETQNQLIKLKASDGIRYKTETEAAMYDDQRKSDMESIRTALLLYSNNNIAGDQEYVFPTEQKYKTDLVPQYISAIPKDPLSGVDYEYKVSATFDTFTLKTLLSAAPTGYTGYLCNQEECRYY